MKDLDSKVRNIAKKDIKVDEDGRYIPFCDMNFHRGIVKTPRICENRKCHYYYKLRVNERPYGETQ